MKSFTAILAILFISLVGCAYASPISKRNSASVSDDLQALFKTQFGKVVNAEILTLKTSLVANLKDSFSLDANGVINFHFHWSAAFHTAISASVDAEFVDFGVVLMQELEQHIVDELKAFKNDVPSLKKNTKKIIAAVESAFHAILADRLTIAKVHLKNTLKTKVDLCIKNFTLCTPKFFGLGECVHFSGYVKANTVISGSFDMCAKNLSLKSGKLVPSLSAGFSSVISQWSKKSVKVGA
jgi:hypothetical protein